MHVIFFRRSKNTIGGSGSLLKISSNFSRSARVGFISPLNDKSNWRAFNSCVVAKLGPRNSSDNNNIRVNNDTRDST